MTQRSKETSAMRGLLWIKKRTNRTCSQCEHLWLTLSAYADGEASAQEAARVEAHLASCGSCNDAFTIVRQTIVQLREVPDVEPPLTLRQAILSTTSHQPSHRLRPARHILSRRLVTYSGLMAAGAAAALLLLLPRPTTVIVSEHGQFAELPQPPSVQPPQQPGAAAPDREQSVPEQIEPQVDPAPPRISHQRDMSLVSLKTATDSRKTAKDSRPTFAFKRPPAPRPSAKNNKIDAPLFKAKLMPEIASANSSDPGERTAEKPDMTDMSKMNSTPMETPAATARVEPAVITTPITTKITLAAAQTVMPSDQLASLAGLKRSLQAQKPVWRIPDSFQSPRDRILKIDLVRGSF